ncbi:ABC transporter permease subunit [Pasteurellaceae bacterium TAE3-ERU1]|uniref:ABC transporter permease subunit n=1 Tax=Spirabiliibacterium mucosae TaxID=28156 RepID=UPI001AAC9E4D|nr:ABC transporter permease subunit [Spirabiliibacterium mucosae]MBE2899025.1 ABC transporter permease subunit [Spirabiliibacterium mucosae]MBV7388904.1 ABC transporter permease subunit [Pasteurellaceae bacterium TAE3-ERU1]
MSDKSPAEFRHTTPLRDIWQLFKQRQVGLFCGYILLLLLLALIFAPWLAPYDQGAQFLGQELLPPAWSRSGRLAYFFGTDDLGRDLFSRIIHGLRYSFGGGLLVTVLTLAIGGVLGVLSGSGKGLSVGILGHFLDAFLSIPILLLAIVIATLMQPSLLNAILAILLASLPYFIHQVYQMLQREIHKDYIQMLRLDGASQGYLLKHIVLPNLIPQFIRLSSRVFIFAILDISALSFISLGAQPPLPEWGTMIREYIDLIYLAPWLVIIPGVILTLIIFVILLFSDTLAKTVEKYYHTR